MLVKIMPAFSAVVLFLVVTVSAQLIPPASSETGMGGQNSITGMILAPEGHRIERRITIRLQSMARGDRVTVSEDNGNFAFRGLPSGDYILVVDKEKDFEPFSQNVSVIQMRGFPAQTYTVTIRLVPKGSTDAKPGVIDSRIANVPKKARELFAKGMELANNRDYRGAIDQLNLAIAEYPKFMRSTSTAYTNCHSERANPSSIRADGSTLSLADGNFPVYGSGIPVCRSLSWILAEH